MILYNVDEIGRCQGCRSAGGRWKAWLIAQLFALILAIQLVYAVIFVVVERRTFTR